MNIVKQRGLFDCAVACIATVTNTSYETIQNMIGFKTDDFIVEQSGKETSIAKGFSVLETNLILFRLGFNNITLITKDALVEDSEEPLTTRWDESHLLTSAQIKQLIQSHRANCILEIGRAFNTQIHMVVYAGARDLVIDLSRKDEEYYETLESLDIKSVTFIKPNLSQLMWSIQELKYDRPYNKE